MWDDVFGFVLQEHVVVDMFSIHIDEVFDLW